MQQDPQSAFIQVDPLVGDTTSYACIQDPCAQAVSLLLRRGTWVHQSRPVSCGARYLAEQQQRARKQRSAGGQQQQDTPIITAEEMDWQRVFIWVEGCTLYTGASEGTPSSNIPPDPVGIMPPIFMRQQVEGAERIKDDVSAAGIANYLYAPKINVSSASSSHFEDEAQKAAVKRAANILMHNPSPFRDEESEDYWAAKAASRTYAAQLAACTWTLAVGDSREIIFISDSDALAAAWVVGINGIIPGEESGILKNRFYKIPSANINFPSSKSKNDNDSFGNMVSSWGSSDGEEDEDGAPIGDMTTENDAYQPILSEGAFARIILMFNTTEIEEGFTNATSESAGGPAAVSARQFEIEYIRMVANVVANSRLASTADITMSLLTGVPHVNKQFRLPLEEMVRPRDPSSTSHRLTISPYLINLIISMSKGLDDMTNTIAILHEIVQQTGQRMKLTVHNLHDLRLHLQSTISLKFGYLDQYCEADKFKNSIQRKEVQRTALANAVTMCMNGLFVQKSASGFNSELKDMSLFNEGTSSGNGADEETMGGGSWKEKAMWVSKIGGSVNDIDGDMNVMTEVGAAHVYRLHYGKKKIPVVAGNNSDVTTIEMSDVIDVYRFGAHEMQQLKAPERHWCLGWCVRLRTGRTMNMASETEDEVRAWCVALNVLRPETKQEWEDRATMGRDMNRLHMLQESIWLRSATSLDNAIEQKCQNVVIERTIWRRTLAALRKELCDQQEDARGEVERDRLEDFESIAELSITSKNIAIMKTAKNGGKKVVAAAKKEPTSASAIPSPKAEDVEVFLTAEEKYEKDMREYLEACSRDPLPPAAPQKAEGNRCCSIQ